MSHKLIKFEKLFFIPISLFFIIKFLQNVNVQKYFYGDDTWLLLGSRFSSIEESLRCCAVSHPLFTLFAQFSFKFFNYSTENTILFFVIFSNLILLSIYSLRKTQLSYLVLAISHVFLLSSPMIIQYSVRTKPYIVDAVITVLVVSIFYSLHEKSSKLNYFILGVLLLISVSSWPVILSVLVITFYQHIRGKDWTKVLNMLYFLPGLIISFLQIVRWRDPGMQNFVIAYYAPTEGGPALFLRWLYFSFLRFFGESNKLDLGFFEIRLSIIIPIFAMGYYVAFKKHKNLFILFNMALFINLIAACLKIWPFGGFRSSIYLVPLFCLVAAIGLEFLLSQISKPELRYLIFLVFSSYLFAVSANPNYEQTTRPFNNEKYSEVLEIINSSDSDILIYHGGLQTTALYTEKDIYLEDVSYFQPGSGTEGFHIPQFKDNNIHLACTYYLGKDNGKSCYQQNVSFLSSFEKNEIVLTGVHIRSHQFEPYLNAFKDMGWEQKDYFYSDEVAIISFVLP